LLRLLGCGPADRAAELYAGKGQKMVIETAITRLDAWLQANRPDYYARLQPGLSEAELAAWETELGVTLPADFRAFFAWRNGQAGFKSFLYNFMLMAADDITEARKGLNEFLESGEFDQANWWQPGWIPFLDNGGGDHYCLDLDGAFGGVPGQILHFYHDWENRDVEFPSFAAWLETTITAFERDMFEYDSTGMQPLDSDAVEQLQSKISPGYPIDQEAG
jgi:cell wall assembly regulator SMI1